MTSVDPNLHRELARLRAREGPPLGAEDRILAALRVTIATGGGPPGGEGMGSEGAAGTGGAATATYAAKAVAVSVAFAGAGLLAVKLVAMTVAPTTTIARSESPGIPSTPAARPGPIAAEGPPQTPSAGPAPITDPRDPSVASGPAAPAVSSAAGSGGPERQARESDAAPSPASADPLAAALAAIEAVRATADPATRLRLLTVDRARFGSFAVERDALEITTLCELGRIEDARAAAERFFVSYPRSALKDRIRRGCPDL